MAFVFIVLALVCLIGYILLHQSGDKAESQFNNRSSTITNSSRDLLTNQKYAIVGLLAFVQGSSSLNANDNEASSLVQSTMFSLGLSKSEVEKYLISSQSHDPEREIFRIVDSLKEIRDRHYLEDLYQKSLKIAKISGDIDTIEVVKEIFRELGF